jgi:hypothetical protein
MRPYWKVVHGEQQLGKTLMETCREAADVLQCRLQVSYRSGLDALAFLFRQQVPTHRTLHTRFTVLFAGREHQFFDMLPQLPRCQVSIRAFKAVSRIVWCTCRSSATNCVTLPREGSTGRVCHRKCSQSQRCRAGRQGNCDEPATWHSPYSNKNRPPAGCRCD